MIWTRPVQFWASAVILLSIALMMTPAENQHTPRAADLAPLLSPRTLDVETTLDNPEESPKSPVSDKKQRDRSYQKFLAHLHEIPGFQGVAVNGKVTFDENGSLIRDRDLRSLFDFFLTLRQRVSHGEITKLLNSYLSIDLNQEQIDEVQKQFADYQQYLSSLDSLMIQEKSSLSAQELRDLLETRRDLRREYLGEDVAEAFFADEEQYEEHQWQLSQWTREGTSDAILSPEQRESMDSLLSDEQRQQRAESFKYARYKDLIDQAQDQNEQINIAKEKFGDEAATRLQAVAQKQKTWQRKLQQYSELESDLRSDPTLNPLEIEKTLESFRQEHFSASEQLRLIAVLELSRN